MPKENIFGPKPIANSFTLTPISFAAKKWPNSCISIKNKNIAITIIKHPKCKINELEGLTTKIAEVIVEAIYELYGIKLEIKIPNDLLLNGKKICGILTEIHKKNKT